jgi:Zn-dependent peptidase ImmA (M78 family)
MLQEIAREELTVALDKVSAETLASAHIAEMPVNAVLLAERLGLTVAWDDRQQGRARLVNLPGSRTAEATPSILLKHDPRIERLHWAVAHEIGEALAERVFSELAVDPSLAPIQARETIANGMASRLLLPKQNFAADGKACNWELFRLKEIYATASHELIARRMLDFTMPVIIAVYDQNRVTWRKGNSAFRVSPAGQNELDCRRRAYETGEMATDDGPPTVRAWPIHEPLWKREIVRVEIDEFACP